MPALAKDIHTEELSRCRHRVEIGGGHSYHLRNGLWIACDYTEAENGGAWTHVFTKNAWVLLVDVNSRKFRVCPDRDDLDAYIEIEVPYQVTFNVSHNRSRVLISGHHEGINADFMFVFSDQGFKKEFVFHEKAKVPAQMALGFRLNGVTREGGRFRYGSRHFGNLVRPFVVDSGDADEQKYASVNFTIENNQIVFDLVIPEMAGAQFPVTLDPTLTVQGDNDPEHSDYTIGGNTNYAYGWAPRDSMLWWRAFDNWGRACYKGLHVYKSLDTLVPGEIVSAQWEAYQYDLWSPDAGYDVYLDRVTEDLDHLNGAHFGDDTYYSGLNQCVFEAHGGTFPTASRWNWRGGYPGYITPPLNTVQHDTTYQSDSIPMPTTTGGWMVFTGMKDMIDWAISSRDGTLGFCRGGFYTTDGTMAGQELYSAGTDRRILIHTSAYTDDVNLRPKLVIEYILPGAPLTAERQGFVLDTSRRNLAMDTVRRGLEIDTAQRALVLDTSRRDFTLDKQRRDLNDV